MGLLSADLERFMAEKKASPKSGEPAKEPTPIEKLQADLEHFAGAGQSLTKEASDSDYDRLYTLHKNVEKSFRNAVKMGKKDEADALVEKFSEWRYLRGAPGEPGDMHPFPAPEEK